MISCTCCTDDEEDIAALQKKTLAIALPPPHNPKASQVDTNAIISRASQMQFVFQYTTTHALLFVGQ
jgi:cystathionine beta-lyase/cystathionine gamma-synthase